MAANTTGKPPNSDPGSAWGNDPVLALLSYLRDGPHRSDVPQTACRLLAQLCGPACGVGVFLGDVPQGLGPVYATRGIPNAEGLARHLEQECQRNARRGARYAPVDMSDALQLPMTDPNGRLQGMLVVTNASHLAEGSHACIAGMSDALSLSLAEIASRWARKIIENNMCEMILFDPATLRIERVQSRAFGSVQLSPAELTGAPLSKLLPNHTDAQLEEMAAYVLSEEGARLITDVTLRGAHGQHFPAQMVLHVMPGLPRMGLLQVLDVSELHAKQQQLLAAVEVLPDGFVLFDRDDRLVLCNSRYKALYPESAPAIQPGNRFEDMLRYGLERHQYAEAIGREEEWLQERLRQHYQPQVALEQDLGHGRWLRVLERETPEGGRVGFRVDISSFKRTQADLAEAQQRAEKANAAKSAFLAMISHEIRTPLNGVIGMAELLSQSDMDEVQSSWLNVILDSSETLLALINDLLDVSKIEAGRMELEQLPISPVRLAQGVLVMYEAKAKQKGVKLSFETEGAAGKLRRGDPHRLKQILNNLLSNALKFTDEGSISVRLKVTAQDALFLTVIDTGIGMTPEQVSRVFEDFEQADSTTTRKYGGTGLGMGITRRLVEAMDGHLELSSEEGVGTRLDIELPLPLVAERKRQQPSSNAAKPGAKASERAAESPAIPDFSAFRILVVDDNATNRTVLKSLLRRSNAQIVLADSGARAIEVVAAEPPDVILMDISMPEMDGTETLRKIRLWEEQAGIERGVPTLAVTAHALPEDIEGFKRAGFYSHIAKPVKSALLHDILSEALGLKAP